MDLTNIVNLTVGEFCRNGNRKSLRDREGREYQENKTFYT